MINTPQPAMVFSEVDTTLMRDIYMLAASAVPLACSIDTRCKHQLASIILGLVARWKGDGRSPLDRMMLATEAIEIMLTLPGRDRTAHIVP